MKKATFKIIIRDDKKTLANGKPLYLRITYNRKTTYKNLGLKIDPKDWDKKKGVAKKSYPNSVRLNNHLKKIVSKYEDEYLKQLDSSKQISLDSIKNGVFEQQDINFFAFFETHLSQRLKEEKFGTHDKERAIYNKIKTFTKSDNLLISSIDYDFLEAFREHLQDNCKNTTNTISANLKVLRMLLNKAERQEIIKIEDNPFRRFKMKSEPTQIAYLTEEEIAKIRDIELDSNHRIYHHRQMFLFACYACGLRVSDLLTLKWSNICNTHIEIKMKKTKNAIRFKLMDRAIEILDEYRGSHGQYVFPFIPDNTEENLKYLDSKISSCTAHYNKNLRIITNKAGITKKVTSHVARHTFATIALRQGIPVEYVSKLLGHKNISTTLIYSKIINAELDKAIDQIKF